jgi:capsular exopolysaccharide synthesis family protein
MLDTQSDAKEVSAHGRWRHQDVAAADPARDRIISPRAVLAALRRHAGMLAAMAVSIPLAAAIALHGTTPRYTATGALLYDPPAYRVAELQSILRIDPTTDAVLASQAEVLHGLRNLEQVADALHLGDRPEFNPALRPQTWIMRQLKRLKGFLSPAPPPATRPGNGPVLDDTRNAMLLAVQQAFTVNAAHTSHVITVSFVSQDSVLAAAAVNLAMDSYIKEQLRAKLAAVHHANEWLDSRMAELREQVRRADDRIAAYRADRGLIQGMHAGLDAEQVSHLTEGLVHARADLAAAEARLDAVRGRAGAATQAAIAPSVATLRGQQDLLRGQLQGLSSRLGPNHPDVLNLRQQLAEAERAVTAEMARVVSATEADTRAARERVGAIEADLRAAQQEVDHNAKSQIPLAAMQRDADAARTLLQEVLGRSQQIAQQAAVEAPDAHEISLALPPAAPSAPRVVPMMAGATAFGLLFGLLLVYVAEVTDRSFRTGADVRSYLGLPCLALIPDVSRRRLGDMPLAAYATRRPLSPFAEQLRALRAGLWTGAQRARVVAVTAARPAEGKTSVALALARAAALGGERVCVLDCDVRQPSFARLLLEQDGPGLTELLSGAATDEEAIRTDRLSGMRFITAGQPDANTHALFMSSAMAQLLERLREAFDLVILDTPPAQAMNDTRVIAHLADATLVCLRWRTTPLPIAEHALTLLAEADANVIGVALTRVDTRAHLRSGFADAEVYHPRYGGHFRE